ncbi:MAG TPA: hypothetical protein VK388_04810 [Pyrinomonadaceae bacterium]|nr:hypothetical protein [Pyrinomonadaceae bacterium]
MKKNLQRVVFALALCALFSVSALADGKSKMVTFDRDVIVGDTLVKRGSYKVTFDKQTNVLTIKSGKKIIARATARLEDFKYKSERTINYRMTKRENENAVLSRVTFGAQNAVIEKGSSTVVAAPANGQQ